MTPWQQAANCRWLATYLGSVPAQSYRHAWFRSGSGHACGTTFCAYGHACQSGYWPALGWTPAGVPLLHLQSGEELYPREAADELFGPGAYGRIFSAATCPPKWSPQEERDHVILCLRIQASMLMQQATGDTIGAICLDLPTPDTREGLTCEAPA